MNKVTPPSEDGFADGAVPLVPDASVKSEKPGESQPVPVRAIVPVPDPAFEHGHPGSTKSR